MKNREIPRFYSPADVAHLLGVTRETIYNGIRAGTIQSYKFGRLRRISDQQLQLALLSKSLLSDNKGTISESNMDNGILST